MKSKRNTFSGSLGFVLAAAGSAVGLGNIWRFPYLAARDGGGIFLVTYLVLALTFGFTLLTTEVAIGRKTRESPLTAYGDLHKGSRYLGLLACIIPMIILPYYCVIGGWVIKYFLVYLTGAGSAAAAEGYFSGFITDTSSPIIMMVVFLILTVMVVLGGVINGIEKFSRIIMPLMIILILVISVFSLTLSHTDESGTVRTGLQGLKILFIPDMRDITLKGFLSTLVDAMGQLFYSLSIAMGIMIAFGSYMKDETDLSASIKQIEIFDTGVAFLAGVMIIPAVFVFNGTEGMQASGPGLMFVSLPVIFNEMGPVGRVVGCMFFAMVLFAAITSSVSILEAVVSSFMDRFGVKRERAVIMESVICLFFGILVCLGYNKLYFEFQLPNGATGQILDIMDYISNNLLMPITSMGTCILIGWILKPEFIINEVTKNGEAFGRKKLYIVMIKYVAPVMLFILFLKALGILG